MKTRLNWWRRGSASLPVVLLVLAGCATAPFLTGTALQVLACELAQARPAAVAPLRAAGTVFTAYGGTSAPTAAELNTVLAAALNSWHDVELTAFAGAIVQGYGPLYASLKTEEDRARLRTWFAAVGSALSNGAECKPAQAAVGPVKRVPTWQELAKEIERSAQNRYGDGVEAIPTR